MMLQIARERVSPKRRIWNRVRVQLAGGIIFAAVLPMAGLALLLEESPSVALIQQTTIGILFGITVGYYFLKNITIFPGMRVNYYVVPSFLVSYGIVLACFFFLRLEYSRPAFLSSFGLCLTWFYLVYMLAQRQLDVRIGVVPFGEVAALREIGGIHWDWLTEPELDGPYDALVADLRSDIPDRWEAFIAECAIKGVAVFHVKQLRESITGRVEIEHLSENSFGSLVPFMAYLKIKRLADFLLAAAAGAALLPFLLLIALLVRLDSPGPALFRQERMGYRGRTFRVAKFRTMGHPAGQTDLDRDGAMTKEDDPRVTKLGRFLRRTRIDELPQILNILKGEMSWIGPRPEAVVLSRWYEGELPFYRYRHIVPPGITGWAQVNQGHVSDLDQVNHKLHYDFYYITNFSPWLDILILIRTAHTVLTGFGSR
jgi:lipopolysaccharide/colanic/teichoic acid biosynthesis glycosyltransferase